MAKTYWMSRPLRRIQKDGLVDGWCCAICHYEHNGHWTGFWWHKVSARHPFTSKALGDRVRITRVTDYIGRVRSVTYDFVRSQSLDD